MSIKWGISHEVWDNSLLDEMNGWVRENLERNNWKYIDQQEYEKIISQLAELYHDLPVQLIHRDVHFGNFLFSEGRFSGYIDFDLSQRNIRIFDLCYFLLGLLSEEEKLGVTEKEWFEFLQYVFRGYENILQLSEAEKKAVPYVMECIELLFVSYFDGVDDLLCAKDAYRIFEFVRKREENIWDCIGKENSHIKQLQPDDLQNCFSFWDFEDNLEKRKRIENEIVNKRRIMYAYILNDEYVAGMSLYPIESNTTYLSYLAVKEECRDQGIGTKMINYACQISKRSGYSNIALKVDKDNLGAKRLYERLGFVAIGIDDHGRSEMRAVL